MPYAVEIERAGNLSARFEKTLEGQERAEFVVCGSYSFEGLRLLQAKPSSRSFRPVDDLNMSIGCLSVGQRYMLK